MTSPSHRLTSIWLWAFGYFAAYAPYSLLTKALSDGRLGPRVSGEALLPLSTLTSVIAMVAFLLATRWWHAATPPGASWPRPSRWTALSGLCGATILTTTTLAYTFEGVSIVFMMLLMRGGVLVMAPVVDALSGRRVRPRAWLGLALTVAAVLVASISRATASLGLAATLDVVAYLAAYFVRLRFMSRLAKSDDAEASRRYFVEEQLVSTPVALLALAALALVGQGHALLELRRGFTEVPLSDQWGWAVAVGVLSQGTGIFGALVLLDRAENAFAVPVNRAASVLAGVLATVALQVWLGGPAIVRAELIGAGLVAVALVVLGWPQRAARAVASSAPKES